MNLTSAGAFTCAVVDTTLCLLLVPRHSTLAHTHEYVQQKAKAAEAAARAEYEGQCSSKQLKLEQRSLIMQMRQVMMHGQCLLRAREQHCVAQKV